MVLSKYLCRELINLTLLIEILLIAIIASNMYIHFLAIAASGSMLGSGVASFIGMLLPSYLTLLFPIAVFFSIVLTYGRLFADNELTVMFSNGMTPGLLLKITMIPTSLIGVFVLTMSLGFLPMVAKKQDQLNANITNKNNLMLLGAGQFNTMQSGQDVVYVRKIDKKTNIAKGLFIFRPGSTPNSSDIILADQAQQKRTGPKHIPVTQLSNAHQYQLNGLEPDIRVTQTPTIDLKRVSSLSASGNESSKTTWQLLSSNNPNDHAELFWRLNASLSCWVLALLALAICRVKPRKSRYSKLIYALLTFLVYFNVLTACKTWVGNTVLSWVSATFICQIPFLFAAASLLCNQAGVRITRISLPGTRHAKN